MKKFPYALPEDLQQEWDTVERALSDTQEWHSAVAERVGAYQLERWCEEHKLHIGDELVVTLGFRAELNRRKWDDYDIGLYPLGAVIRIKQIDPYRNILSVEDGKCGGTGGVSLELARSMRHQFLERLATP
jgi:hypothetical protein